MTGEDWVIVKDPAGRIKGVSSSSQLEPFKQENFSEANKEFAGKTAYKEWQFVIDVTALKKKGETKEQTAESTSSASKSKSPFVESPLKGSQSGQ
jgi:hypothetical protein